MSFLRKLFSRRSLDGEQLARSEDKREYGQIELLSQFITARPLHDAPDQQRWSRVLPLSYLDTIRLFEEQGWLEATELDAYQVTAKAMPFIHHFQERLALEKAAVMPKVRRALEQRDTGEALDIRRNYEARFALGQADWTGPEPQLSYSALTRRILFLDHWLLDGLSAETVAWLKLYAAEQHLWGVYLAFAGSRNPCIGERGTGNAAIRWRRGGLLEGLPVGALRG